MMIGTMQPHPGAHPCSNAFPAFLRRPSAVVGIPVSLAILAFIDDIPVALLTEKENPFAIVVPFHCVRLTR